MVYLVTLSSSQLTIRSNGIKKEIMDTSSEDAEAKLQGHLLSCHESILNIHLQRRMKVPHCTIHARKL